jgi:hypothetical protein
MVLPCVVRTLVKVVSIQRVMGMILVNDTSERKIQQ